ncbi:MAG TPA: hypothetical protein DCY52_06405 [Methylococcaceae bacterium]|nr:hypothetical protein [Methylococcaceae bacterium]
MDPRFDYNTETLVHRDCPGFFMASLRLKHPALCVLVPMLVLDISGCGQKGPLYMEGHEPKSQRAVAKKRREDQAKQAEDALRAQSSGMPREEAPDLSEKDNMPVLAPSAPN